MKKYLCIPFSSTILRPDQVSARKKTPLDFNRSIFIG